MRLSPLDPETYRMQAGMAAAHLLARRFETASSWAAKSLGRMPNFLLAVTIITASHALAGQMDEARRAMQHLRRLDPKFGISHLKNLVPIQRPEDLTTFADGLRKAGLPE